MHGEGGDLLQDVGRVARRARDHLVVAADELVEVVLALHARVLVDRHERECTVRPVERPATPTLEGAIVRLEPLAQRHADDLWEASRDPRIWRWLPIVQPQTREAWDGWMDDAAARVDAGLDARVRDGARQRAGRPSARRACSRSGPSTAASRSAGRGSPRRPGERGANTEAKLLQLEYAFDALGCRRVEFKTDALNERARAALAGLPSQFEGIHRKHMLVRDGENRDSAWYSVVDDEWPTVHAALQARLDRAEASQRHTAVVSSRHGDPGGVQDVPPLRGDLRVAARDRGRPC